MTKKITISNNSSTIFTITNITFNTPSGIDHSANLSELSGGIASFTATSFSTYTTMTTGSIISFTIEHFYKTGFFNTLTNGTIVITATEGLSKTINTDLIVTENSKVSKPASLTFLHQIIPIGTILMWSGNISNIPSGWQLCNGTNGTPDLRNKFIIAADADSGGYATTSITGVPYITTGTKDAVIVSHNHSINDPTHRHAILGTSGLEGGGPIWDIAYSPQDYLDVTNSAVTGITINSNGTSGTNQNLPPYYALAFIMKMTDENDLII